MTGLTLVRNPGEPAAGMADRGLEALMRLAVEEIRMCRQAIGTEASGGLAACADRLGSLDAAIRDAAQVQLIMTLGDPPVPARFRTRHLQAVQGDAR